MRDASATLSRATAPRAAIAAVLLTLACGLGGCASGGAVRGSFARAGTRPPAAFGSIGGPPPQGFDRRGAGRGTETNARNPSVGSREGPGRDPAAHHPPPQA